MWLPRRTRIHDYKALMSARRTLDRSRETADRILNAIRTEINESGFKVADADLEHLQSAWRHLGNTTHLIIAYYASIPKTIYERARTLIKAETMRDSVQTWADEYCGKIRDVESLVRRLKALKDAEEEEGQVKMILWMDLGS
jgi:hypothetical protein